MKKINKCLFSIFYWIISLTWGCLLTIPGILVALLLRLCDVPAYTNGCTIYFKIGGNWGGICLGTVALLGNVDDEQWLQHTRRHEFGHSMQQLMFGPFQIFLVAIPSAIRYWYFRLTPNKHHHAYDWVWFESTASNWGKYWIDKLESTTK